jgi:uncharacterized membrane protein
MIAILAMANLSWLCYGRSTGADHLIQSGGGGVKGSMRVYIIAYIVAAIVMGGLDFCWLRTTGDTVYRPVIGSLMADDPDMKAAVAFYVIYLIGVLIFAVRPGLAAGTWQTALMFGALFGFFAYATYDLTNMATLKVWSLKITLMDMAWGTFLTGTTAAVSTAVALAFEK